MNNNVVITIFEVESEAFKAFTELRNAPAAAGYSVPEAALIKNEGGNINVCDAFGMDAPDSNTTTGIVVGSLLGLLGGPVGVILGAGIGALAGSTSDAGRAAETVSAVAVVASKIYDGEIAIAALVSEEEPAFDKAFESYKTMILRYDAADIADDVDRLHEVEAEISREVIAEAKAENKAAREERRDERRAKIKDQLDEYNAATNREMGNVSPM